MIERNRELVDDNKTLQGKIDALRRETTGGTSQKDYEDMLKQRDAMLAQLEAEKQDLEDALADLGQQLQDYKLEALSERKNLQEKIQTKTEQLDEQMDHFFSQSRQNQTSTSVFEKRKTQAKEIENLKEKVNDLECACSYNLLQLEES